MLEIESADPALIEKLLHQYAPVRLDLDVGRLAGGDRRALGKLVECSSWIDRIYWKQRSVEGWGLRQRVSESSDGRAPSLRRLLDINFGPWDTFDGDRPFCGDRERPPTSGPCRDRTASVPAARRRTRPTGPKPAPELVPDQSRPGI